MTLFEMSNDKFTDFKLCAASPRDTSHSAGFHFNGFDRSI